MDYCRLNKMRSCVYVYVSFITPTRRTPPRGRQQLQKPIEIDVKKKMPGALSLIYNSISLSPALNQFKLEAASRAEIVNNAQSLWTIDLLRK